MPSDKTKKLLEGLGKITDSAPKPFQQEKFHSYTNRYYPNTIHPLPAIYDKAKRKKDEDGEEYIMIDRVYGSLYGQSLMQKDGTEYNGKLYNKRRLITSKNTTGEKSSFYSRCTVTADGRWFDNGGLPIEAPSKLEPEKVKTQEEIEEEQRAKEERAKAKEAAILAQLK
tara:strand:+ start:4086 stop:4592 length:507 start_codon:yes stop_codon:yes gene_type:complete